MDVMPLYDAIGDNNTKNSTFKSNGWHGGLRFLHSIGKTSKCDLFFYDLLKPKDSSDGENMNECLFLKTFLLRQILSSVQCKTHIHKALNAITSKRDFPTSVVHVSTTANQSISPWHTKVDYPTALRHEQEHIPCFIWNPIPLLQTR